ncbi:MAG TPA: HAMP domain-containing sensor histidine kinase [Candidatus Paceibacterota bacterium]
MALVTFILDVSLVTQIALLTILLQKRRSHSRFILALYVLAIIGWTLAITLTLLTANILVSHFVYAFAAFGLTAQLWFACVFPDVKPLPFSWRHWYLVLGAFFSLASFIPGALFHTIAVNPAGYVIRDNGFLSVPYALFAIVYMVLPPIIFWRKARAEREARMRSQLIYLTIGFLLFLVVSVATNSILPVFFHIYVFNAIGPVFSLVLAVAVFYIIYRHRFLDIRVVLERGLVYILLVTLVTGTYFGALPWLLRSAIPFGIASPLLAFALFLASGAVIYGVERYFERARLLARERAYAEELEKKVAERTEHLEELQAYQRRMVGDISHALQTPLTVLTSAVENLKRDSDVPENDVALASQSIERLSQLMYALLRLSKLEALPAESHERFSLSAAVSDIAEYIETVCQERGITLTRHIEPDIKMAGDQAQIEELLTNLLSNAVRYTQRSAKREITLTLQRHAGEIDMAVADTGSGIPADSLPHLFERFYRAPNNTEPGTGLGLAIVKRIAELHGGTISVESTEGQGATFTVRFPAA